MGEKDIRDYLNYLSLTQNVSSSTQNQARLSIYPHKNISEY